VTGWWFFTGTPVSYTNKTERHDITEILFESRIKHHKPKQILAKAYIDPFFLADLSQRA
jgi:hypothetical protein